MCNKSLSLNDIIVDLMPDDDYILITYKIYDNCIEIIDLKRKKKDMNNE